ncbi:hypothetical protein COU77_02935 [Candidatus Peregrinibacteria bacterium CG10_big_fil_rev_8_21_14_0_10_49_16]|nr:MAG: hypothetical protein COW95_02450 [Candidatus Peregrinibacteria bacterium CG22_combo_CG10-13_8_21_14_all_49_11]PIR51991.1 MAG: hypothetical protein COU77_02935 [Candidatus Peregrinibacteria bacterium CG10_big_fil_rev_8_21_14_0_10_49_16]
MANNATPVLRITSLKLDEVAPGVVLVRLVQTDIPVPPELLADSDVTVDLPPYNEEGLPLCPNCGTYHN